MLASKTKDMRNPTSNNPIIGKNRKIKVHHLVFRISWDSKNSNEPFLARIDHPAHKLSLKENQDINRIATGKTPLEATQKLVSQLPEFDWTDNILDIK